MIGSVEGTNMVLERRAMAGGTERDPALIVELNGLRVDILVVVSPAAARAPNTATTTIPIVMILAGGRSSASCARLGAVNGMTGVSSRSIPCIRACMRGA